MRFTSILLALKTPKSPFPRQGNRFDALFVEPQKKSRKKAWEGQDKDKFFRDKYAHVHAKQLKLRKEEKERKQERLAAQGIPLKVSAPPAPQPKPDFARKFAENQAKNGKIEYIYGTNAVKAVLTARKCYTLFTSYRYAADLDPEILALCREKEIKIETQVPTQHLQIMADQGVHNRVVLKTEKPSIVLVESLRVLPPTETRGASILVNDEHNLPLRPRKFGFPLGLYIDQVTDTHNMGALLRSAQFFGADFVALSSRNSAPISPAVVKASSGATEFVPILQVPKPLKYFDELKESGWSIIATAPDARALREHRIKLSEINANSLCELAAPTLLVVGNEGDGIRVSLLQRSTNQTTLKSTQSHINSLNVSVAAAVLLHAFAE